MKIYIASDHAGYDLKNTLSRFLTDSGHEVVDCGPYEFNETDDYPDYVAAVASEVSQRPEEVFGVIIGGSGQGEAIMANRFSNVRAVVYQGQPMGSAGKQQTAHIIEFTREHNDSNVLSLGAWFVSEDEAKNAVLRWLSTPFKGEERHLRRIRKIEALAPHGGGNESFPSSASSVQL